jgi:hypothetical protein
VHRFIADNLASADHAEFDTVQEKLNKRNGGTEDSHEGSACNFHQVAIAPRFAFLRSSVPLVQSGCRLSGFLPMNENASA